MKEILLENKRFFGLSAVFIFCMAAYQLQFEQIDAILFFSRHRSAVGDFIFYWGTHLGEGIAFVGVFLYFLWKKERSTAWQIALSGVIVVLVSQIFKFTFQHPRPTTYLADLGLTSEVGLNYVYGYVLNGYASFPSGHTTGGFALYATLCLYEKDKNILPYFAAATAIMVGLSRIYLAAHFPEDVLFGAILGLFLAVSQYFLVKKRFKRIAQSEA